MALGDVEKAEELELRKEKQLEKVRLDADIARILEASKPKDTAANIYDLETTKAVMEKVFQDAVLESTSNLTRHERDELVQGYLYYYYTRNPALLVYMISFLKMSRSLTDKIINMLESLFNLPRIAEEEHTGRWGRFKQFVGGR
jgi:hypothetical protein